MIQDYSIKNKFKSSRQVITGFVLAVIVSGIAFFSVKQGLSQYYENRANVLKTRADIVTAISLDSKNPNSYKTQGILFESAGEYQKAIESFKQSLALSPEDYLVWLKLGFSYYKINDFKNAEQAYKQAISLAPYYFEPKQYLGMLYLKTNDSKQAFCYLSQAAIINKNLLPQVLQLAVKTYRSDPLAIENAVTPNSVEDRLTMAVFFIEHNMMSPKIEAFLTGREVDEISKDKLIKQLLEAKNNTLAFSIWLSKERNSSFLAKSDDSVIINSDFETDLNTEETGFGWRIYKSSGIAVSYDADQSSPASNSLKFEFQGVSSPSAAFLTQLLIVKPNERYRMTFDARTENLVTGGLPVVKITETVSKKLLGQSVPIITDSKQWRQFNFDFSTGEKIEFIQLSAERITCTSGNCPIFGTLWLDNFSLKKLPK